ncbi:ABC transporter substrate-binding protein [Pelomonas aquatica]|jgi:ABC-type transport system substrate-binding protein|uniref:ABC transporter substrate-binding protein n=1 Tax=Pelomonas aquatica TaxID=431058 RepID=A0A9X4LIG1_9BURK|nr:ABC transporter substrate-binding protein [Pelomonas aquatica]MCY4756526.1 ABC transporter substrate-binding protein [Pelomonas aquatica]MDG0863554.1 ABC transporter substrate-binding protein [Pelomonas aquatica]
MKLAVPLLSIALALTPPAAHAQGKPLVYCADASPEGFDPGMWDSASTNIVGTQMFDGLLGFRRPTTALMPKLAESWEISPDAKRFTFRLRAGVKFHSRPWFKPTRDFNADDVLFTFRRFIDPNLPFNRAFPANFVYPQNLGLARMIEGIDRIDERTIRFRLRRPNVTFVANFAFAWAGIQSAEYAAQLLKAGQASQINVQPVGTGPFMFKSYAKDDVLRMTANPDYWGGHQPTPALVFSISREPNVRVQKIAAGECHVAAALRDVDIATLARNPNVGIEKIQALNISYLSFNLKKPPTDRREVREALDIAIDRDAIFKALFPRGDAMQAVSAFPPSIPGYNSKLKNEFDPARAKALLARAGFANGLDIDLWALPVQRSSNPNGQLMAQLIQQDWARIGVRAHIKTYEWGEYLKRANNGEHNVYMSGWSGETGDADDFLTPNLSCAANKSGVKFCNAEFEGLIDEARATPDAGKRIALYERAQEIFKRERPWITMAHSTVYIPVRKDVVGFKMAPNGSVDFAGVYRK